MVDSADPEWVHTGKTQKMASDRKPDRVSPAPWASSIAIAASKVVRTAALVAFVALVLNLAHSRIHTAAPNEWLIVVKDGQMVRSGVGISHFAWYDEQVAKFPTALQKLPFKAQQVTLEKQGVEVSGFAVWVVNREADGPFKAYKHLGGLSAAGLKSANENLANMAESVIRSEVAKMTIDSVMTKREAVREAVRTSMQAVREKDPF